LNKEFQQLRNKYDSATVIYRQIHGHYVVVLRKPSEGVIHKAYRS